MLPQPCVDAQAKVSLGDGPIRVVERHEANLEVEAAGPNELGDPLQARGRAAGLQPGDRRLGRPRPAGDLGLAEPGPAAGLRSVVAELPGRAFLVSLNEHICPGGLCPPKVDGVLLRYDGHHYTRAGARWAVPLLHAEMLGAGALPASMR